MQNASLAGIVNPRICRMYAIMALPSECRDVAILALRDVHVARIVTGGRSGISLLLAGEKRGLSPNGEKISRHTLASGLFGLVVSNLPFTKRCDGARRTGKASKNQLNSLKYLSDFRDNRQAA